MRLGLVSPLWRLDRGAGSKLTLVSAPAGFGKTTLLAEWLGARPEAPTNERSAAWLSLDPGDNDPAAFWTYVIASCRRRHPGSARTNSRARRSCSTIPPIETVLTTLLAEMTSRPSSPASLGMIGTSSTTWRKKSYSVSPKMSGASCCKPPSWIG